MSQGAYATEPGSGPWAPPPDDELSWFRVGGILPARPRPLEYTLGVQAFTYGVAHALESLNCPLYDVRSRLFDGQLYLAAVPSAMAERDLERRMMRMRDATLRFSRNIRAPWEREIRREVQEYNERMAAFPPRGATTAEIAAGLFAFKRVRANQWFAPTRAVIAPTAMLQAGIGDTPLEDAMAVVQEVRDLVVDQGTAIFDAAIEQVAARLVQAGSIDRPDDVVWLEYGEVRDALEHGSSRQAMVAARQAEAAHAGSNGGPATIGPTLPADAPRMYLLREVLALLGA
jgi:hypothetical protein